MGSWFETCFVSHLPIRDDERCRVFFLERMEGWAEESASAGFSYPYGMWAPCSFALAGTYDSHGRVEGIKEDSLEARMAMRHIRERLVEFPPEEDGRRNPAVLRATITPFTLQEAISEGRGKFTDYQNRVQPIGFVMVRDDVYQAILRRRISSTWRTPKRFTVARYVRQGEALVEALKRHMAEKATHTDPLRRITTAFDIDYLKYEGSDKEYDFQRFISNSMMEFRDSLKIHLVELVEIDSPDLPLFLQLIAKHMWFSDHLYNLRRAWMPQCGKGSQDDLYDDHIWLAKLVQDIAKRELQV